MTLLGWALAGRSEAAVHRGDGRALHAIVERFAGKSA